INSEEAAFEFPVAAADRAEVFGEVTERQEVEAGRVVRVFGEGGNQRFGGWLACATGERAEGAVDHVGPGLDAHEVGHFGVPAGVVAMHLEELVGVVALYPGNEGSGHHGA